MSTPGWGEKLTHPVCTNPALIKGHGGGKRGPGQPAVCCPHSQGLPPWRAARPAGLQTCLTPDITNPSWPSSQAFLITCPRCTPGSSHPKLLGAGLC